MKQLLFMFGTIGFGIAAGFVEPLLALVPYYVFAILQPQALWEWALPGGVRWSLAAGAIGLGFVALHAPSLLERIRFNPVVILMGLFTLLLALSCITAYNTAVAQQWFSTIFKTLLVASILCLLLDRFRHIVVYCVVILGSTGLVAWHFNSLYLFDGRLDIFVRGLGALDNNGISLLMLMGLPMAYAFAAAPGITPGHLWRRAAAALIGLLIIHAVMLSYSRGAMLAGCVGVAWLLWCHRPRWQLLVAGPLLAVAIAVMAGQEIRDEFMSISDYQTDGSAQSRFDSWEAAWHMAWDHPLTGVGIRNANLYSQNYGADILGRTIHNQYLQLAADAGFPSLIVYLAMMGMSFLGARQSRKLLSDAIADPGAAMRDAETIARLRLYEHLCLGIEGAIVTFAAGAMFLSLETFEISLLLMAMAGALPHATRRHLDSLAATRDEPDDDLSPAAPPLVLTAALTPAPTMSLEQP